MQINEQNYNITTYQWDYEFPVRFEATRDNGFKQGDELLIEMGAPLGAREPVVIDSDDFEFYFALTKEEADSVYSQPIKNQLSIPYTVKRRFITRRDGQDVEVLDTLFNAFIIFKSTLKWEGD